jgi:hypothetical protein
LLVSAFLVKLAAELSLRRYVAGAVAVSLVSFGVQNLQ